VILEPAVDLMIRRESDGALFIKGRREEPSFKTTADRGFMMDTAPLVAARVPALDAAGFLPPGPIQ